MIQLDNIGYVYSTDDAARLLGVTTTSVRNWIKKGIIEAIKFTGRWMIPECEMDKIRRYCNGEDSTNRSCKSSGTA